eukprot:14126178-Alexandrium_andersonii.AAC.1
MRKPPTPPITFLRDGNGDLVTGAAALDQALDQAWSPIFQAGDDGVAQAAAFVERYDAWIIKG